MVHKSLHIIRTSPDYVLKSLFIIYKEEHYGYYLTKNDFCYKIFSIFL